MTGRIRVWPENLGNPLLDNQHRNLNRRLEKMRGNLRVKAAGRRNRKRILQVEGDRYLRIIHQLTVDRINASGANRVLTRLRCDHPGCAAELRGVSGEVAATAAARGWSHPRDNVDFCPRHS